MNTYCWSLIPSNQRRNETGSTWKRQQILPSMISDVYQYDRKKNVKIDHTFVTEFQNNGYFWSYLVHIYTHPSKLILHSCYMICVFSYWNHNHISHIASETTCTKMSLECEMYKSTLYTFFFVFSFWTNSSIN